MPIYTEAMAAIILIVTVTMAYILLTSYFILHTSYLIPHTSYLVLLTSYLQSAHINHKPVLYITLQQSFVGFIDLVHTDELNI